MKNFDERLMEIETSIEVMEGKLRIFKDELEEIRKCKNIENITEKIKLEEDVTEICALDIKKLGLNDWISTHLYRAGITNIGDIFALGNKKISSIRGLSEEDELQVRATLDKILTEEDKQKIYNNVKFVHQLNYKMSVNFLKSRMVYDAIRSKAYGMNIRFNRMGAGWFSQTFRKEYKIRQAVKNGHGIFDSAFCYQCLQGKHPKMYRMLMNSEPSVELIKDAILEDFKENNEILNHRTRTYSDSIKFVKLITEFKM